MKPKKSHPHWPSPPLSRLREWQLARLRRYLGETVLPFSAHYHALFERERLEPRDLRTIDDLRFIPFTSKADFQSAVPGANPVKDFVLVPGSAAARGGVRRPSRARCCAGRAAVQAEFEHEFRPLLLTSTTGRSAEPVPFLFTAHDIEISRSPARASCGFAAPRAT